MTCGDKYRKPFSETGSSPVRLVESQPPNSQSRMSQLSTSTSETGCIPAARETDKPGP